LRRAEIRLDGRSVGMLAELSPMGYRFEYYPDYLVNPAAVPVSLTLPLRPEPYDEPVRVHPFFENLLPEGWLLELSVAKLKISKDDVFGLLLATCRDCPGAVEVWPAVAPLDASAEAVG